MGLNLLSLLITFTGVIFLLLYVSYEYSFDKYNKNYENVYRIIVGKEGSSVPAKIAPIIRNNISEIEAITPIWENNYSITTEHLKKQNTSFYSKGFYAKNDLFDIFTFPLLYGDKKTALTEPHTIVIAKDLSEKLFGNVNPVGKEVLARGVSFKVTGVMENIPKTSSIYADYFASFITVSQKPDDAANTWEEWSYRVFFKLHKNVDIRELTRKIDAIPQFVEQFEVNEQPTENNPLFIVLPLSQLHFSNDASFNIINPKILKILLVLALVLTLMGLFNFMNITIAQAYKKNKVIALRQILGGSKNAIRASLILEAVVISLFALLLSFVLHHLLTSYLSSILQTSGFAFTGRAQWYFYFLMFAVIFGVVAGLYPAFYMSSKDLALSLKGVGAFSVKGKIVRNSFLVLQFVFAMVLISVSIAISKQIDYWHHYDIGIQKDNIIYLHCSLDLAKHKQAFADDLLKNNSITDYAFSRFAPGNVGMGWGRNINGKQVNFTCWPVDERFIDFFDIKMVQGRPFSKTKGADNNTYIFNEKAIETFDWKEPLRMNIFGFSTEGSLIGVCKNFNFASLKKEVGPLALWLNDEIDWNNTLFLKLKQGNYTQVIDYIKTTWEKYDPVHEFNYQFLDESLQTLYNKEERIGRFIKFVSLWSIILALTGLLGLVIFSTRQKTKEIGIRKVNGASIIEIVVLLNNAFLRWLLISFTIATPIAYYLISRWLENFQYKTTISWWIFALSGLLTGVIALFAMSWYTIKTAKSNPVNALRYE